MQFFFDTELLTVGSNVSIALSFPGLTVAGCCTREIAVPWKESLQVVELGLWSMLSTAAVVNRPFLNLLGQTTCSLISF